MTTTQQAAILRGSEVVLDNISRRLDAGQSYQTARAGALGELAERWPNLAQAVSRVLS